MTAKPLHVYPVNDLYKHDTLGGQECWCEPEVEHDGMLIVHNSADRREDYESGRRKPH